MPQLQHVVTLASVEDDALGEGVQVIWELEPGARVIEKGDLPASTGFDDPRRLDAFLDAVRWYAASSADVRALQSPFRSGIEIEEYQLDPVVLAIQMPRANLLIADDVGLGKTIEAGLVCQELLRGIGRAKSWWFAQRPSRCSGATRCATSSAWNFASWMQN